MKNLYQLNISTYKKFISNNIILKTISGLYSDIDVTSINEANILEIYNNFKNYEEELKKISPNFLSEATNQEKFLFFIKEHIYNNSFKNTYIELINGTLNKKSIQEGINSLLNEEKDNNNKLFKLAEIVAYHYHCNLLQKDILVTINNFNKDEQNEYFKIDLLKKKNEEFEFNKLNYYFKDIKSFTNKLNKNNFNWEINNDLLVNPWVNVEHCIKEFRSDKEVYKNIDKDVLENPEFLKVFFNTCYKSSSYYSSSYQLNYNILRENLDKLKKEYLNNDNYRNIIAYYINGLQNNKISSNEKLNEIFLDFFKESNYDFKLLKESYNNSKCVDITYLMKNIDDNFLNALTVYIVNSLKNKEKFYDILNPFVHLNEKNFKDLMDRVFDEEEIKNGKYNIENYYVFTYKKQFIEYLKNNADKLFINYPALIMSNTEYDVFNKKSEKEILLLIKEHPNLFINYKLSDQFIKNNFIELIKSFNYKSEFINGIDQNLLNNKEILKEIINNGNLENNFYKYNKLFTKFPLKAFFNEDNKNFDFEVMKNYPFYKFSQFGNKKEQNTILRFFKNCNFKQLEELIDIDCKNYTLLPNYVKSNLKFINSYLTTNDDYAVGRIPKQIFSDKDNIISLLNYGKYNIVYAINESVWSNKDFVIELSRIIDKTIANQNNDLLNKLKMAAPEKIKKYFTTIKPSNYESFFTTLFEKEKLNELMNNSNIERKVKTNKL